MPDTIMPRPRALPPVIEDHCYLRHGDRELRARVFMPAFEGGPFPCLIELHGGGWQGGDLEDRNGIGQFLAPAGFVVVALNFRQGADGYPTSLADINYGVRWAKADAAKLKIDPRRVAIGGASTGAHLAMLAAMRPRDRRYASIPLPAGSPKGEASVDAVVMHWPIINPLSRYRSLLRDNRRFRFGIEYWQTEANAAEGNPMLILERASGSNCHGRSGSRGGPTRCMTTAIRTRIFPATSPSGLSATTARPAARSSSSISTRTAAKPTRSL
jgi:acetyl esterase